MARLCRMTTVYGGGGFRLVFPPRKTGPQSPPSLPKRRRSSYSNFRIVRCGGLWQEIRDQERPLSLKRDDLGILPNSGSIDGITPVMVSRNCWSVRAGMSGDVAVSDPARSHFHD